MAATKWTVKIKPFALLCPLEDFAITLSSLRKELDAFVESTQANGGSIREVHHSTAVGDGSVVVTIIVEYVVPEQQKEEA